MSTDSVAYQVACPIVHLCCECTKHCTGADTLVHLVVFRALRCLGMLPLTFSAVNIHKVVAPKLAALITGAELAGLND